jgi:hypothetical protein
MSQLHGSPTGADGRLHRATQREQSRRPGRAQQTEDQGLAVAWALMLRG